MYTMYVVMFFSPLCYAWFEPTYVIILVDNTTLRDIIFVEINKMIQYLLVIPLVTATHSSSCLFSHEPAPDIQSREQKNPQPANIRTRAIRFKDEHATYYRQIEIPDKWYLTYWLENLSVGTYRPVYFNFICNTKFIEN